MASLRYEGQVLFAVDPIRLRFLLWGRWTSLTVCSSCSCSSPLWFTLCSWTISIFATQFSLSSFLSGSNFELLICHVFKKSTKHTNNIFHGHSLFKPSSLCMLFINVVVFVQAGSIFSLLHVTIKERGDQFCAFKLSIGVANNGTRRF